MRKNVILSFVLALCVVVLSFACVKTDSVSKTTVTDGNAAVLTVSQSNGAENKALEARFLNMLNHNYVYNADFYDDAALVNASMIALLDSAEESYIEETVLSDYVFNMYGKIYKDFSFLGKNLPEKEGYVYILPRGYAEYKHTVASAAKNADGSYTVITDVEISDMDGSTETLKCETLFLPAEDSAFGYNIVYSEIAEALTTEAEC